MGHRILGAPPLLRLLPLPLLAPLILLVISGQLVPARRCKSEGLVACCCVLGAGGVPRPANSSPARPPTCILPCNRPPPAAPVSRAAAVLCQPGRRQCTSHTRPLPAPHIPASPAGGAAVVLCQPGRQAGRVENVFAVCRIAGHDLHLITHRQVLPAGKHANKCSCSERFLSCPGKTCIPSCTATPTMQVDKAWGRMKQQSWCRMQTGNAPTQPQQRTPSQPQKRSFNLTYTRGSAHRARPALAAALQSGIPWARRQRPS